MEIDTVFIRAHVRGLPPTTTVEVGRGHQWHEYTPSDPSLQRLEHVLHLDSYSPPPPFERCVIIRRFVTGVNLVGLDIRKGGTHGHRTRT